MSLAFMSGLTSGLAVAFVAVFVTASCATANNAPAAPTANVGASVRADEARVCGLLRTLAAATPRPLTAREQATLDACALVLAVNRHESRRRSTVIDDARCPDCGEELSEEKRKAGVT